MNDQGRRILLGRVAGALGLRGEVKLESFTDPREAIFDYQPWTLVDARGAERTAGRVSGKVQGKHIVARFPGVDDRDAAEALRGLEIHVPREQLPSAAPGEFYWADLEGLRVLNTEGVELGRVSHLFSTGANDVVVVRGGEAEHLVPFVRPQYVVDVDIGAGTMTVDWDPDWS